VSTELTWLTAHELGRLYRKRQLSPVEVIDATLERLHLINPHLNAFVTVTEDEARTAALIAERRLREESSPPPLLGIPITVKDLIATAGVRTTYGSLSHADHIPRADALAWTRLREAGAILIGKTTTPEFGLLGITESKLTGQTSNPWDRSRTPGGSSGGSAAATAAGIAPVSWASDGGGSIRVPAALCGVVGLKPSTGRVSHRDNTEPDMTEGPIARSVVDAALLLQVTAGADPSDRFSLPTEPPDYVAATLTPGDLSGLRVAASIDLGQGPVDPAIDAVFTAALNELRAAGATVEDVTVDLPLAYDYFVRYWGPDYIVLADQMHAQGLPVWPFIDDIARAARSLSPVQVSAALREVKTSIYLAYARLLGTFDLVVAPTTPTPAFPHGGDRGGEVIIHDHPVPNPALALHTLTESASHAGLPAISVPCGFTNLGLPVGLQFIGPKGADLAVLSAAARYERSTEWHAYHPSPRP
jgi:Asp-tRNA(Asn)/Glu-tRNA(Gln) amidotransferase A subunit family amidase